MRISNMFKALALVSCAVTGAAMAAPLPTDVPESHWAKDAVATLTERGLIQGYDDNTFKGDRAMTRWELASLVARIMTQIESEQVNFATKEELAAIQRLTDSLRPELQALGVRLTALEAKTNQLEERVSELERITFYGSMQTVIGGQCFYDKSPAGVGQGLLDYSHIIGTATGAGGVVTSGPAAGLPMNPFIFGNMTTTDWVSGRALTSGSTFTSTMRLGANIRMSDDFQGGVEFAAYASAGDSIVDAYWGAAAPYNCNPFTANSADISGSGATNKPYTRMCLDHFWLEHKPSKTKLTVGAFEDTDFDKFIYVSEINPNAFGSKYIGNYGAKIEGVVNFSDKEKGNKLRWQAMGTRLADGNINTLVDSSYFTHAEGANMSFLFDEERGRIRLNYLHTANNGNNGEGAASGLYQSPVSNLGWVNPNTYYISQFGNPAEYAGIGSYTDARPMPMVGAVGNDGVTGIPGVPNLGGIGPQDMHSYGLSGRYQFDVACRPEIYAEYAHSVYKPNQHSNYAIGGNMWRVGAKGVFGKDAYDQDLVSLELSYKSIDPTYSPFIMSLPQINGICTPLWRPQGFTYHNSLYALQDTEVYTHNRKGFDAEINWKFLPTGNINLSYSNYQQVRPSEQDVRYSAGCLGPMTPNTNVIGLTPGFIDPVFHGLSEYTFAPDGANAYGTALENPRGAVEKFGGSIGLKYLFDPEKSKKVGVTVGGGGVVYHFTRHSHLSELVPGDNGLRGENQNNVDLRVGGWKAFVNYQPTEALSLDFSVNSAFLNGHYDPLGILNEQAVMNGTTNDKIVDLHQIYPEIKVDYDINSSWNVGLMGRYYWTTDRLPDNHLITPQIPSMNINFGPQPNCHPAVWEGWQVLTSCNFKF